MGHGQSHSNQHHSSNSPNPNGINLNQFELDADPSQHNDSLDVISPLPLVSRSSLRLQRASSCPPANNTMSLILRPQKSNSLGIPTLGSMASTKSYTKSYSILPHSVKSTTKSGRHKRRNSALLIVNNGITGKYISSRICKIAAKFWHNNIENLSLEDQLEIGCSIFFGMLSSNDQMKKVMKKNCDDKTIEATSLKYLDMMGWLIRFLITDDVDLSALLIRLGRVHRAMGIGIHHFPPMLAATHETFAYYFEAKYCIEVKYAMDEIFSLAAQVMTEQPLQHSAYLMNITQQFAGQEIPFLKNLNTCLKSTIGKEYLFRYLAQTWCDEIVIFLKSLHRFKCGLSDKARFMIAREITKASIEPSATFSLNLSYGTRKHALFEMSKLEVMFLAKVEFEVTIDFFLTVEAEINKLMLENHWRKFVNEIQSLQRSSIVD